MPEIWSIAVNTQGLSACALGLDMARRFFSARFQTESAFGLASLNPRHVSQVIADALIALLQDGEEMPLAIALCTSHKDTALFVDRDGLPLSHIFIQNALPMPRRDIPDKFSEDTALSSIYRQSLLRRIKMDYPDFCLNQKPGIYTLGAYIAFLITAHAKDACEPMGVPFRFPNFADDESNKRIFDAMGLDKDISYQKAHCGHAFARISPNLCFRLNQSNHLLTRLAGIPLFHAGSVDGGRAYACASDPLSWSASVGYDMRMGWNAGVSATANYEISIVDNPGEEQNANDEDITKELTRDDWTRAWNDILSLDVMPGPRPVLSCYGYHIPNARLVMIKQALSSLSIHEDMRISWDVIRKAPLGSGGIHYLFVQNGIQIVGLHESHRAEHLLRALFESMIYELRYRHDMIKNAHAAPVRLIISRPWPIECAQWAADILARPLIFVQNDECDLGCIGAAIALMRDLELPLSSKPAIDAAIIEPSSRADCYQQYYHIHCALKESL